MGAVFPYCRQEIIFNSGAVYQGKGNSQIWQMWLCLGGPRPIWKSIRAVNLDRVNLIYNKAVEKDSYPENSQENNHYFAGPIAMASNTCQNKNVMLHSKTMQYSYIRNKSEYLKVGVLGKWRGKYSFLLTSLKIKMPSFCSSILVI